MKFIENSSTYAVYCLFYCIYQYMFYIYSFILKKFINEVNKTWKKKTKQLKIERAQICCQKIKNNFDVNYTRKKYVSALECV